jgi:hypothetical protein
VEGDLTNIEGPAWLGPWTGCLLTRNVGPIA